MFDRAFAGAFGTEGGTSLLPYAFAIIGMHGFPESLQVEWLIGRQSQNRIYFGGQDERAGDQIEVRRPVLAAPAARRTGANRALWTANRS